MSQPSAAAPALSRTDSLRRLAPVLRHHRGRVALTIVAALGNQASGIAAAATAAALTGRVAEGATPDALTGLLVLLVGFALLKALMAWAESWVAHDMAFRVMLDLRVDLFAGLVRLAPAWLDGRRTGDVARAALADVEALEWFYAHTIAQVIVTVLVPVGALAVLATIDVRVALALLPFVALLALVPFVLLRRGDREGHELRARLGGLQAETTDVAQGLRELVLADAGHRWRERLAAHGRSLGRVQRSNASRMGLENGASEALVAGAMVSVLLTGALLVEGGELAVSAYPVAVVVAGLALAPVLVITGGIRNLGVLRATASRVVAVVDTPARVVDRPGLAPDAGPLPVAPSVRFEAVQFGYQPGRPVLRGLDLEVPSGAMVALVGASGAGKSTSANLLLRFWDPDAGRILMDGVDLRDIPLARLRRLVSLVPQDAYLFSGTIAHNLRLARADATDADLRAAAEAALVTEFTDALPDGLDTTVGERGATLSGGQRQRVALAQALLRDAGLLILDEAVAGVDTQGEALLQAAIRAARGRRTTIVIAHRLSTILAADSVIVMRDGRAVQAGPADALLAAPGPFRELVARQLDGLVG